MILRGSSVAVLAFVFWTLRYTWYMVSSVTTIDRNWLIRKKKTEFSEWYIIKLQVHKQ